MVGLVAITELGTRILVMCANAMRLEGQPVQTYEDIATYVYGRHGMFISVSMVVMNSVGGGMAFFIFLGRELASLTGVLTVGAWMLIVSPLPLLLAMIPSYKQLFSVSAMGTAVLTIVFFALIAYSVEKAAEASGPGIVLVGTASGCFQFVGVTCFALSPTFSVVPIQAQMTQRTKFGTVFTGTLVGVAAAYTTFGLCGYLALGHDAESIVTLNLPRGSWSTALVTLVLANVILSFPLSLFPCTLALDWCCYGHDDPPRPAFVATRTAVVAACLGLAIAVPHFGSVLSILGAFGAGLIGGVFPAAFFLHLHRPGSHARTMLTEAGWSMPIMKMLVIVYGVVFMALCFTVVVFSIIDIANAS